MRITKPFTRVLIANRGEIACRIARTARRMGLHTIAVYSAADAGALHVRTCDEALAIGGMTAADSYLRIDALIEAARRSGAEALHPGYGFLSENPALAEACDQAGLVFVGPPAAAIRTMGSKAAARAVMDSAGVALTPGYHGADQEPEALRREAARIGYPVLIKASMGGGGRGIRRVERAQEFASALAGCQREASASFGDARVLIERCIERPRHIEFQVFADSLGNCVHLFERDCSVQRRHQKVLEEAPAPGMTPQRRAAMGAAAVSAARAVGYVGAGTVEFIVAPDGDFFFMEMNTRLQVEHPVTELISGIDLVEWQLRVAAGEPLPLAQEHLAIRGHAIEARIAAEDPDRGFLPATGRLDYYDPPPTDAALRIDSGVATGSLITPYYDSLLAKLIVWGADRAQALLRLRAALERFHLVGVANNVDFLARLVACDSFVNADLDTGLIERERPALFAPHPVPREAWLCAAIVTLLRQDCGQRSSPWDACDGWRLGGRARRSLVLRSGELEKTLGLEYQSTGWRLTLDEATTQATGHFCSASTLIVALEDRRYEVTAHPSGGALYVFWKGRTYVFHTVDPTAPTLGEHAMATGVRAPMPGRILELIAAPGATVGKGTPLLVLEAMKIEHTVLAPAAGVLREFTVAVGEQVVEGAELAGFEPTPS
jgi:3-methylcrotonyl-CoA carboxylase alpha subunit